MSHPLFFRSDAENETGSRRPAGPPDFAVETSQAAAHPALPATNEAVAWPCLLHEMHCAPSQRSQAQRTRASRELGVCAAHLWLPWSATTQDRTRWRCAGHRCCRPRLPMPLLQHLRAWRWPAPVITPRTRLQMSSWRLPRKLGILTTSKRLPMCSKPPKFDIS